MYFFQGWQLTAVRTCPSLRHIPCMQSGTTQRFPPPFEGGSDLFWKLQAETYLLSSGLGTTVVIKPCGLADGAAGGTTLLTGHDDALLKVRTNA
jgi:hypothetical protein